MNKVADYTIKSRVSSLFILEKAIFSFKGTKSTTTSQRHDQ
jgi:hypothetical protein